MKPITQEWVYKAEGGYIVPAGAGYNFGWATQPQGHFLSSVVQLGPSVGVFSGCRFEQRFVSSCATRKLLVEIIDTGSVGAAQAQEARVTSPRIPALDLIAEVVDFGAELRDLGQADRVVARKVGVFDVPVTEGEFGESTQEVASRIESVSVAQ